MVRFDVKASSGRYPVIIESGCCRHLVEIIQTVIPIKKTVVITDENVASLYESRIDSLFDEAGINVDWIVIPPGEESKSLDNYRLIIEELLKYNFSKDGTIIAFGGGVVLDLAGFAAATFMRGVKWISIPTSLLAMADASIGGKTSIHSSGVKNAIGAFHQPCMVIIDPEFLKTLSKRDFNSGLAEIMKMAILPGGENFSIWQGDILDLFLKNDHDITEIIIGESCGLKASVIERDEFDQAGRIILNLGHTLGHAIESAGHLERYSHGEAVCIGVLFISDFSHKKGDLSREAFEKIKTLFKTASQTISELDLDWEILHDFILHDKKRKDDVFRWVYPIDIGKVAIKELKEPELRECWNEFREHFELRIKGDSDSG